MNSKTIKEQIKLCYLEDMSIEICQSYFLQFNIKVSIDLIESYYDEFLYNELYKSYK